MKKIFQKYNLKVRPAPTPQDRVVVRVGMILSSFVGLVSIGKRLLFTVYKLKCVNK